MTHRLCALLLAGLLPITTAFAAGPLDRAIAAYQRNDYRAALDPLLSLARQGDSLAQVYVGLMYYNGHGVAANDAVSFDWFRRSAEQGNAEGQFQLGYMYLYGYGVSAEEPDPEGQASAWFLKAAEQGHAEAQFNLGLMYISGSGVERDHDAGLRWIEKAAAGGSPEAQRFAGSYK